MTRSTTELSGRLLVAGGRFSGIYDHILTNAYYLWRRPVSWHSQTVVVDLCQIYQLCRSSMVELLEGQKHDFNPVEVSAPHIIYVALGFFIVLVRMSCFLMIKFGMFSMLLKERLYLGEAPLALVFGIIIGNVFLVYLHVRSQCCVNFPSEYLGRTSHQCSWH